MNAEPALALARPSADPPGPASSVLARQPAPDSLFSAPAPPNASFGLYLHIPFCTHICPYCDFNTYAGQSDRIPAYVDALCREMAIWSPRFAGREAASIFIGGGTPSLLGANQIRQILAACHAEFDVQPDIEVTLEANPNDLTEELCAELREAGINRLSIGVQTLDHRGLRVLGRLHSEAQTSAAVRSANDAGFDNISLDFIYGWPGQTLENWRSDLNRILSGDIGGIVPRHLSLYELIVEPGTPMADAVARGIFSVHDQDTAADFSDLAEETLRDAGWLHYEIANWASAPQYASRHNATYWRNGDYAGIGAGAHGHVDSRRTMNQPSPRRYIASVNGGEAPTTNTEVIDTETAMAETMMLGLRLLLDGVSVEAFQARHDVSLSDRFGTKIERLRQLGLLEDGDGRVRLTSRGAAVANSVCAEFLST